MFRQKNWKIVKLNGEGWELYDLEKDPTEINDLAESMPEKLEELTRAYEQKQNDLNQSANQKK
jgi:arylsulfatase